MKFPDIDFTPVSHPYPETTMFGAIAASAKRVPDAPALNFMGKYTTYKEFVEKISEKSYDSIAVDTICNATYERQREAALLAEESDIMLVIGGRSSSNTQKLYEICRQHCPQTYYIQTALDIGDDWFWTDASVGITAGASTPKNIIEEVQCKCQN